MIRPHVIIRAISRRLRAQPRPPNILPMSAEETRFLELRRKRKQQELANG